MIMSPTRRPLIGITCLARTDKDWSECALGVWVDCLFRSYTRSVAAAGGIPMAIPLIEDVDLLTDMLSRTDGVIVSGGSDILPYLYGEQMRPGIGQIDPVSDEMELEIARQTLLSEKPVLGICRGIQVLAVAAGGSLIQDINTQVPNALLHWQPSPKNTFAHQVDLNEKSKLAQFVSTSRIWVNSHHHQAVRDVPPEFLITARASDGVVEALEHSLHPFYIGVQWHPEGTIDKDMPSLKLFEAFIKASANQRTRSV
jgi:putative glutamine amidotransferase